MPALPRVSVVIPCYNLGRYLAEAIDSVQRQTFSDLEIIVVDDGSTEEETADALRAASGPNVKVVRSENRGLSAARNLGITYARGEYVSCLDADDIFDPAWLELAVARLDADPSLAFVSHWLEAFGDETGPWTPQRSDLAGLLDQNVFNGAAMFRRTLVDEVGGFDESMRDGCEDWEFWVRVMERGHHGATIPAPLYRYRRRPDSMSRVMNESGTWLGIFSELIDKHAETYREHLLDLLLRREWTIAGLCKGIDAVQEELPTVLEPAVRMRTRELEQARSRLHQMQAREQLAAARLQLKELEESTRAQIQALQESSQQRIDDLHRSWSWRVTAPLRRVFEWLGGGRPPRNAPPS